ncbi:hypothetical protein U0035_00565 [Niabella yanshanensis]|uniref:Uncharacterized protein n=1 Tax=Niabella yanshanensis TaxID=577386 RepID=A0ABZ0W816_9BACT|nr:hypothetical protein [Niabella yanshanensis]WQD38637.1 hypothetical protein U0035_00565 [Niabella yanshanensis]
MKLSKNILYFIPLALLLIADLVLIVLDIRNFYQPFPNPDLYDIETNDSYAEDFQNLKWIIMMMALAIIAVLRQEKKYFTWILVILFLFLEDVFRIHQSLGHFFYNMFGMTTGQRGSKIMELFAAAFLGFIFMAPVFEAYKKGDALFRKHSKAIFILLGLFLFFAIVIDQAHRLAMIQYNWKYNVVFGLLEDGGELIAESLLTGYLIFVALQQKKVEIK